MQQESLEGGPLKGSRRKQQLSATILPLEPELDPPPTKKSKTDVESKKRKTYSTEARELILHVIKMCELERSFNGLLKPLSEITGRTSFLTGVPEQTIWHVKHKSWKPKEQTKQPPTQTKPKLNLPKRKMVLDDRDIIKIKNLIRDYHIRYSKVPLIKDLLPHVRDQIPEEEDNEKFLYRVLHNIGYRRKKLCSKQSMLVEDPVAVSCRDDYLERIRELRSERRNIFYVYECVIDQSYTLHKTWVQKYGNNDALREMHTFTLICAASENGFLAKASLFCKTTIDETKNGALGELTSDLFVDWLEDSLIPHLPPNSVVVMDDAPHHAALVEKPLSYYASKKEMVDYLKLKRVNCNEKMRRTELYKLIDDHTAQRDVYIVDDVLTRHGHGVMRLPPYMVDLSPAQLAMDQIEQELCESDNYEAFNLRNVRETIEPCMSSLTEEEWKSFFEKVLCLEDYYWTKDGEFETAYDEIMKNMRDCIVLEEEISSEDSDDDEFS